MLESLRSNIVGWVEPTPGIVGFRYTQPNLHFWGAITKCETQQKPISQPITKSFFSDQTGCPLAGGRAHMKQHLKRTAEYRISNRRMSKSGIASLSHFLYIRQNTLFDIRCWTFDVRRSLISFSILPGW